MLLDGKQRAPRYPQNLPKLVMDEHHQITEVLSQAEDLRSEPVEPVIPHSSDSMKRNGWQKTQICRIASYYNTITFLMMDISPTFIGSGFD
jgi:hypothetical protein